MSATTTRRLWILAAAVAQVCAASGLALAQDKIPVVATFSILADMTSRIGALKDRASILRDEVVARAEQQDPFARGGGGRFG